jgi:hypothetical protein
MTLIASDGLEYEDLTQRLLGRPKDSSRNDQLRAYRQAADMFTPGEILAWQKAYDEAANCPVPNFHICHRYGLAAMHEYRRNTDAR